MLMSFKLKIEARENEDYKLLLGIFIIYDDSLMLLTLGYILHRASHQFKCSLLAIFKLRRTQSVCNTYECIRIYFTVKYIL